jgi:hypothetical protein
MHDNACYVKSQETELLPPDLAHPLFGEDGAAAGRFFCRLATNVARNFANERFALAREIPQSCPQIARWVVENVEN